MTRGKPEFNVDNSAVYDVEDDRRGSRFNFSAHAADLIKSPGSEPLMMESQLGRMILAASASTEDEMSAAPDQDGRYGPMDGLLEEIATRAGEEPSNSSDRRPGPQ